MSTAPCSSPLGRAELLLLGLALAVGLWLRLSDLASLPFGVWYDEAVVGLGARAILENPTYRPIFYVENQNPAANIYLAALSMRFFGETPLALRVPTALAGALGIPAVFFLTRRLFGSPRIALLAAWFLAVSSWHVTLSRFPTSTAIYTMTLDLLVLFFLTRGVQDRRPADFALAGLLLGLDLQFYFPARLTLVVVMLLLGLACLWRQDLRRPALQGALVTVLGLAVTVAPLAWFALRFPEEFNRRLGVASVLPEVERAGSWAPLADNLTKHLLMFNVAGDRNGRHNLPGRPMLDPLLAPLFVLGLGMALLLGRRPSGPLLVGWWGVMLAAGVLSLNFEAPQGLRSSGAVGPTLILAALPLGALWDRWVRSPWGTYGNPALVARTSYTPLSLRELVVGQWPHLPARWQGPNARMRAARAALPLAIGVLVVTVTVINYRRYFVEWANDFAAFAAHSAAETLVAQRLRELGPTDEVVLSQFFADRPPTIQFLAPEAPAGRRFDAAADLPLGESGRRVVFFLDPQEQAAYNQLRQYYPGGQFEELTAPFGGPPLVRVVTLTPTVLAAIQGVEARYSSGSEPKPRPDIVRREAGIASDPTALGLPLPVRAEWSATLKVPRYGTYRLVLEGPASAELFLDGSLVASGGTSARLRLAAGNHTLLVRALVAAPGPPVQLLWEGEGVPLQLVPATALFLPPVTASGLLGKYYPNATLSGEPSLLRIDPQIGMYFHILPLPRPYSVEWTGSIRIDQPGRYRFATEQISSSQLFLDGQLVLDNPRGNELREGEVQLDAGLHTLRLVFVDREPYSHIYLFWTPPGRPREIIPSSVLLPPQGEDLPPTGAVGPAPSAATVLPSGVIRFTAGPPLRYRVETSYGLTGAGRLLEPRAAALDASGNLHVLDSGALQVVVFAPDGTFLRRYAGPAASAGGLQEPTGLVIASNGRSYLLDATTASVAEYAPDGQFLGTIPLERRDFYKPRGLSIGSDDHLLVADTGQNRVLRFSLSGKLLAVFGGRKGAGPGEMLEPTDAALLPSGDVLVLDTGNRRLQWFTPDGRYRAEWPINWSVPLNGPHLTLDPQGRPLVTDPERGRFARYDVERAIVQFAGGPDQFRLPVEILRDPSGAIYLVETGGGKVTRLVLSE
ncbi:MAG: hypothetical protein KatS3mg061_1698 [Dehalococcoidia bacterium]|nr:MAG: hypothetical protein KatS3mg061_1698 [Dehalococcoidia bacterium]